MRACRGVEEDKTIDRKGEGGVETNIVSIPHGVLSSRGNFGQAGTFIGPRDK